MKKLLKEKRDNILISIIVPIYNASLYLDKCLLSIINQTHKKLQIILVDDGSTDNSFEICQKFLNNDNRIILLKQENSGAGCARNLGLAYAKGDYIGFVDSDDYIDENMYKTLLQACIGHKCDLSFCGRYNIKNNKREIGLCPKEKKIYTNNEILTKFFTWDEIDASLCDKLFASKLLVENKFPTKITCEDVPVVYKAISKSDKIISIPTPMYNYVHHYDSVSAYKFSSTVFDFEYQTKIIYNEIFSKKIVQLEDSVTFYRIKSIEYALSFISNITKTDYKKYKQKFQSYKKEIKSLCNNINYSSKIIKKYLHGTLRLKRTIKNIKYYFKRLKELIIH